MSQQYYTEDNHAAPFIRHNSLLFFHRKSSDNVLLKNEFVFGAQ